MTQPPPTDDGAQPYQLTRRGLIRGAGAGALALASLRLPEEYRPVGQAQAFPWLVAGAAGGALLAGFALGFAAYAGYNYLTGGNAEEVQESAATWAIYNSLAASITSRNNAIRYHADDYGVDLSSVVHGYERGDGHLYPNDNELMHATVEHYTAEAAAAWHRGDSLTEAQQAARDEANLQLASAEWSIIALHNDTVSAAIPALSDHYDTFGAFSGTVSYRPHTSSTDSYPTPIDWGTTHVDQLATPTSYQGGDGAGLIGVRDITDALPIDLADLPDSERPENGFTMLEIATYREGGSNSVTILSPYAVVEEPIGTDVAGGHDLAADYTVGHSDDRLRVTDPESDRQLDYSIWEFAEMIAAVRKIGDLIRADLDQTVATIYDGLAGSQLEITDVMSGRQLYQRYQPADDQSRAMIQLASYGSLSAPDGLTQAKVQVGGQTHTGTLFVEPTGTDPVEITDGGTLTDADYGGAYLLPDDPDQPAQVWESGETIEIVEIYGDTEDASLSYTPRERYTASGPDVAELEADLAASQERYSDLMERIEELEGSTWPFGAGGGDLSRYGIVAAIAALAALLIGR